MSLLDSSLRPRFATAGRLAAEQSISEEFLFYLAERLMDSKYCDPLEFQWLVLGRPAHNSIAPDDALQGALLVPSFHCEFEEEGYLFFLFAWANDVAPFVKLRAITQMQRNGVTAAVEAINFGNGNYRLTKVGENPLYRKWVA